ncbi:hypothetical protein EP331_10410 [bacterium]|nr:MAG: hypothetical protein EP331_10410 [bacterium]
MTKISNPDYSLSELYAVEFIKELPSGANRPVLCRTIDKSTGEESYTIIKLLQSERMDYSALSRELAASWIATEMDIPTPTPAKVHISPDFVKQVSNTRIFDRFESSIGYNFGSNYIESAIQPDEYIRLNESNKFAASLIYTFDFLIGNPDRTIAKPNLLLTDEKLMVIDHELAFVAMAHSFTQKQEPWKLNDSDLHDFKKRIIPKLIKKSDFIEVEIEQRLRYLDEFFWSKMIETMPKEWYWESWNTVIPYLKLIIERSTDFINNVKHTLS